MTINHEKIAEGIFGMMPEDDKVVLRCGMIPKQWIDVCVKVFKKSAVGKEVELAKEKMRQVEAGEIVADIDDISKWVTLTVASEESLINALSSEFVRDFEKKITV